MGVEDRVLVGEVVRRCLGMRETLIFVFYWGGILILILSVVLAGLLVWAMNK